MKRLRREGTKVFAFARRPMRAVAPCVKLVSRMPIRSPAYCLTKSCKSRVEGQLIWIDEAGLLGTKTMAHVFALAEKLDARVLLSR